MGQKFAQFAHRAALIAGHYVTFVAAVVILIVWAVSGPLFGFSQAWQLSVNTGTTIVTFLMVFIIQNTQNRDALAMHLKLDELISSVKEADNAVMGAEDETDEQLAELKRKYAELSKEHAELRSQMQQTVTGEQPLPSAGRSGI